MKVRFPLFTKILCWFLLNLLLVLTILLLFFLLERKMGLHTLLGKDNYDRLGAIYMLVVHDINTSPRGDWEEILARHATIHGVDFALYQRNGEIFKSSDFLLPQSLIQELQAQMPRKWTPRPFPANREARPPRPFQENNNSPLPAELREMKGRIIPLITRTSDPTRYWAGMLLPVFNRGHRPALAFLLISSESITGNGFFFDPLPWLLVVLAVVVLSTLFWLPMVRHITRPLSQLTEVTRTISEGNFQVTLHEPRKDEIGLLAGRINTMATKLGAFVAGQKRFMGDIAHELGSPISRIQFGLAALEQRVDKEHHERVASIIDDLDHLSKLVNELLAFSRAEMKADSLRLEPVSLAQAIETAIERECSDQSAIVVKLDEATSVAGSKELLIRAISNVLRNAISYAGTSNPVVIHSTRENGQILLTIRDQGPGVPEEFVNQLFEPFFRPDSSRNAMSGGVGLGLAIVKTCIESCGGTVSACNVKPAGFEVAFRLNEWSQKT